MGWLLWAAAGLCRQAMGSVLCRQAGEIFSERKIQKARPRVTSSGSQVTLKGDWHKESMEHFTREWCRSSPTLPERTRGHRAVCLLLGRDECLHSEVATAAW